MAESEDAPVIIIDTNRIFGWDTFHSVFAEACGFPGFYGANMNAWIDCMTCIDDVDAGMTKVHCRNGHVATLKLTDGTNFALRCPEQFQALVECAAFVNWRRLDQGQAAVLALAFYKSK